MCFILLMPSIRVWRGPEFSSELDFMFFSCCLRSLRALLLPPTDRRCECEYSWRAVVLFQRCAETAAGSSSYLHPERLSSDFKGGLFSDLLVTPGILR